MSLADGVAYDRDNPRICPDCGGVADWYRGSPIKACTCIEPGTFGGYGDIYHEGGLKERE